MAKISAVNILVDSLLPEEFRDPLRIYDKKGMDKLMTEVAKARPDLYPKLAKVLGDIGRNQAYFSGATFRLSDFKPVMDRNKIWAELDLEKEMLDLQNRDPEEKREALAGLFAKYSDKVSRETNAAALGKRNNIALTVLTGARGKEGQLRDLVSSPGYYPDAGGRAIPWFIRNSFSEGLQPADYLAGSYAARGAVTDSKRATAQGGFLAKTLSRAAATHIITQDDCGTINGLDLPIDEPDLRGRVLQRPAAGLAAGTVLDRKALARIKASNIKELIVRSPLTCNSENGMCSKCFGVKAEGRFPKLGEHVGVTASNALGEPLTQAALSLKHITSGKGVKKEFSGLDYIMQFVESPEEFKDRSIVTKTDGRVERVEAAPQGGSFIYVSGEKHYVPLEREITVQSGEVLEAGDSLTDGLTDVEDILNYKGLGEARRYWSDRLSEMAKASAAGMDRRQFEVLAKANVDHIQLDDPVEDGFLPDDKVRYSSYVHKRQLPYSPKETRAKDSVGMYLEQPVLHHTVGTKITPRMAQSLADKGFEKVWTSDKEPSFRPEFIRLQQVAATDDDWLASLGGSYLGAQLQQGVMRAQDTNVLENIHPVPRLAYGEDYGKNLETTGKF